ncbi:MAG: NAD(P)/FAD-dependent oxidoreductase [Armatimonadota bacterium]
MDYDCAVIGAGPSGLYSGTYLGRFLRRTVIYDGGKPRASWIPGTYNFPGVSDWITGLDLLKQMRRQCEHYAEIICERVISISGSYGDFTIETDRSKASARVVLLAAGAFDIPPDVPEPERHKGSTIRHCAVCDAYEARGRRLAVFGWGSRAARQAVWLTQYTRDITVLTTGHGLQGVNSKLTSCLSRHGIPVIDVPVEAIETHGDELGTIRLSDGSAIEGVFRGYSAMGLKPNSELAAQMGAELDGEGFVKVNGRQSTNIRGLYAVGDIVARQVAQISTGFGNVAVAATDIHNSLLVADGVFEP